MKYLSLKWPDKVTKSEYTVTHTYIHLDLEFSTPTPKL